MFGTIFVLYLIKNNKAMMLMKRTPGYLPSLLDDFFGNNMDDLFYRPLQSLSSNEFGKVNVIDNDNNYQLEVSLPGVDKGDVDVYIKDNMLTIKSKNESEKKIENKNYIRREFKYNMFERSFTLPEDVLEDDINASFDKGILTVTLKKDVKEIEETKEIKKIEIQ
jgi:HSP20 family protein